MAAIKRSLNVAVVGMGNMGVPITRNIAFKSRAAVYLQIHSRSLERARKVCNDISVDGAQCAMRLHTKYSTVTKWSDIILLTQRDVTCCRHALLEAEDALLPHARAGQIIVDHSTVDVETSKECAHVALQRGAVFLDAPMSGNPQAAHNGQLTLMVGGEEQAFQKLLQLFRLYAEVIHRMGESGSGSAAKAISSMLVGIHTAAAAEAMRASHSLGVEDYNKLVEVLDASWGGSTMLRRNGATMQRLLRNEEKLPAHTPTTVDGLLHDMSLLGKSDEVANSDAFPLFSAAWQGFARSSTAGMGDRDIASVVHFSSSGSGTTTARSMDSAASAAARSEEEATAAATTVSSNGEEATQRQGQQEEQQQGDGAADDEGDVEFY